MRYVIVHYALQSIDRIAIFQQVGRIEGSAYQGVPTMNTTPIVDQLNNAVALLTVLAESLTEDYPRFCLVGVVQEKIAQAVEALRQDEG